MPVLIQRIAALIIKHLRGELTSEENTELQEWIEASAENRDLFNRLSNEDTFKQDIIEFHESKLNTWNKIDTAISEVPVVTMKPNRRRNYLAAASVIVLLSAGAWLWFQYSNKSFIAKTPGPNQDKNIVQDVAPGGDRAVLKLSDGSIIYLDSVQNGILAKQGNISIVKTGSGEIKYSESVAGNPALAEQALESGLPNNNIVTTPKGGQYQITLPDGSKVWLNAASSIKYPTSFNSHERRVEITGEAYFEINPLPASPPAGGGGVKGKIPFIVKTITPSGKESEIEVLGTHFNVNAYDDEGSVKTTLLEGKVRVSLDGQSSILKPGQQAQISNQNKIRITNGVNIEDVVAGKKGMFQFSSVDIETIMRQVARWYDITIEYPAGKPTDKFIGGISRNVNLSQLLKILELSEVHFKLEGKKLIVMP